LQHEKVIEAVATYKSVCASKKISSGIHVIDSDYKSVQEKIEDGFRFIAFSTDFYFMGDRIAQQFKNKLNEIK